MITEHTLDIILARHPRLAVVDGRYYVGTRDVTDEIRATLEVAAHLRHDDVTVGEQLGAHIALAVEYAPRVAMA